MHCGTHDSRYDIQCVKDSQLSKIETIPNEFSIPLCTFAHHSMHSVIIQYYYSDKNKHADKQHEIKKQHAFQYKLRLSLSFLLAHTHAYMHTSTSVQCTQRWLHTPTLTCPNTQTPKHTPLHCQILSVMNRIFALSCAISISASTEHIFCHTKHCLLNMIELMFVMMMNS